MAWFSPFELNSPLVLVFFRWQFAQSNEKMRAGLGDSRISLIVSCDAFSMGMGMICGLDLIPTFSFHRSLHVRCLA